MDDFVNVNLEIPELSIKINLNLNQDDLVWDIKQNILNSIASELKDGLNHDFYQASTPFKAAKFLDAERMLREYCLQDGCTLQMIAKKRIYKVLKMDKRKLSEVNSKTSRKRLIQLVQSNSVKKVLKLLDKGIDPNFVDAERGECAMTIAAGLADPSEMLYALVDRGAHLDLRNRQSFTALHKAASLENYKAIQTLLNLGASPNYKDKDSLTPLYHAILSNKNTHCAEALLKDYALLGSVDSHALTEVHQASQLGKVSHIELLLSYGADVNSCDLHGNTPLHLAVKHQQVESARMLLFRGADKEATNLLNQTPLHLASFLHFPALHQLISSHSIQEAAPIKESPVYNDKSRSTLRRRSHGNLLNSKLKKLSLSSPYLHHSVTNLHSPDVNPSVRSFESEGTSTGSADQQFEFDLNNDSRPSSWTKSSEVQTNASQATTPTSSLRDLHTPMRIHNRSELVSAILARAIPEVTNEGDLTHKPPPHNTINNYNTNKRNTTNNTYNYNTNTNSYNSNLNNGLSSLRTSSERLMQDEYLNSDEVEALMNKRASNDVIKAPLYEKDQRDDNMGSQTNRQKRDSDGRKMLIKPPSSLTFLKSPPNRQSDTYLNSLEVDQVLKKFKTPPSQPIIIPSPHLLKPVNRAQKNFEKPIKNNSTLPFKPTPPSFSPKSPTFPNIPPPPTFPKNFTKILSPTSPSTSNVHKYKPFTPTTPSNYPFSPPLPPPPSDTAPTSEFPFPPPPPPMFAVASNSNNHY